MKRITALLLVIALFGGCASDCYAKTNWGFGPVVDWGFGPVDEVGDSNEFGLGILARKSPSIGQEMVCENGQCTIITSPVPVASQSAPVVTYSDPVTYYSAPIVTYSEPVVTYQDVCPICGRVRASSVSGDLGTRLHRTGYGILGNRQRPLGWRFRPFLRVRMGW